MNPTAAATLEPLAALAANPRIAVLVALLVTAAVIDWRTLRIPNWLTLGGTVAALAFALLLPATARTGLLWSIGGLAVGLLLLLPFYVVKAMGAGDVKLMAMAGAFLGLPNIFYAVLFTFVAGGVAALAFALWHRVLLRTGSNVRDIVQSFAFATLGGYRPAAAGGVTSVGRLPYGVSICVGTVASLVFRQLGFA